MKTRGKKNELASQMKEELSRESRSVPWGKPDELSREHLSYLRLLFFLVVSIFLAEVVAMGFIYILPPLPYQYTTLIDAGVMIILIFPALYFLSFRPLILHIEKRQRAESAVRQLSRIVEQTEDTVVVTDRRGVIEYVNPAFERRTGFAKEDALGKTPRVLKSGIHNRDFYQNLWDTVQHGAVFQSEIANRKKNGELFYEVKTITPLRDANGAITHFVATGKDITEHKRDEEKLRQAYNDLEQRIQDRTEELRIANSELEDEINVRWRAEEALRQSEQRLKRAQEIARLGSWDLDLVTNQLTWSDEVYRIFGLQPQEFGATYEAFLDVVHPEDRAAVHEAYAGSLRDGNDQYEIEHRIVKRSNGEVRIVHEKCEHFRGENGGIIRSVGMVHDITERKQAEEALKESEQKFRSAFANAAIGFAMTTPHGRFVDANPAYCALTGHSIDELMSLEFPSLIHPQDRAANMQLIGQMLAGQINDFVVENRYYRADYKVVWVRKSISLVRHADGSPRWIIALVEDITERKHAEDALRDAHIELEQRVEERTKELAIANRDLVREIAERKEIERQLRLQTTAMESAANGIVITDCEGNIQWANPAIFQVSGYDAYELIGKNPHIFSSGQHDAPYYRRMWETIQAGEVWQGEIVNRHKNGALYVEEQTITPVRADHGQITHFIAIKQDITERKQAEEKLEQRNFELEVISNAERNQRQFSEALIEAALTLNKSLKLSEVLTLILEQIKGAISYQLADILFLEGDSFYDACHLGGKGWPSNQADINNRFLLEDFPLLNQVRQSGEPALVADTQQEPSWTMIDGFDWVRSFLSAPLLVENKVIGFVNLFSEQPGYFTQDMRDRLVAFAVHAAVAIQNAWLFEQVQASTERLQSLSRRLVEIQENERLYISRELHDEAGQVLTSLLVDLRLLEKNASQPDAILKIVAEMERSLNDVIENLHRMAMALRPASLDHVGLVAALRQHVEMVGEKHGIRASFRSSGGIERLPANVETVLYRTVQEALTNVVRHAQATRVDVVLMVRDEKLVIIVEDDGVGFDPNHVSTDDHLGLFGLRERTEMIGGTLAIESAPGKGTTIMMEVGYADTLISRR